MIYQLDTTTAQENKVTITLIAVVVLFLICQTPAAVQLVYTMNNDTHTNLDIGEFISFFFVKFGSCSLDPEYLLSTFPFSWKNQSSNPKISTAQKNCR